MERFEPALCRCGFGLLCCASGSALAICGIVFLMVS